MLKIFNTLTKKKEIFKHAKSKNINIYVCGVTAYDLCHIGHARTFVIFDIIIRYLKQIGYNIFYVRNITDIDDKIIKKAEQQKESVFSLASRMIRLMKEDFLLLNLIPPHREPRVTKCMPDIFKMIDVLIKKKYAYVSDSRDVLFSINSYKNYGLLSHRVSDCCLSRQATEDCSSVDRSRDFVLWKYNNSQSSAHVSWLSPWGRGRPGWHIECSAIINKFFKNNVNIHGGGVDLLFPHHENEMAQSKSFQGSFCVEFWMHAGMVILNNQKMSKSLLNAVSIRHLLNNYDPEVVRYYFLSTHYRHPLYYSEKNLCISQYILIKMYQSISDCIISASFKTDYEIELRNVFKNQFYSAMNNDFNTSQACLVLQKLSQHINKIKKNNTYLANILASDLVSLGNILGLFNRSPKNFLYQTTRMSMSNILIIENLVNMRQKFRLEKQWNLADLLRKKLFELGVIVEDNLNISTYRFKK
ncbi:cysteine--tRNA ligase [Buchnera aphidicola]|uniref:cysteine--tRNA ligase n=1 Tax=Buchnera aphidicola TaxID=9 RepID=UPI00094C0559|nr:cysteine--tRNA ligase [Buchnera aphidicola]